LGPVVREGTKRKPSETRRVKERKGRLQKIKPISSNDGRARLSCNHPARPVRRLTRKAHREEGDDELQEQRVFRAFVTPVRQQTTDEEGGYRCREKAQAGPVGKISSHPPWRKRGRRKRSATYGECRLALRSVDLRSGKGAWWRSKLAHRWAWKVWESRKGNETTGKNSNKTPHRRSFHSKTNGEKLKKKNMSKRTRGKRALTSEQPRNFDRQTL